MQPRFHVLKKKGFEGYAPATPGRGISLRYRRAQQKESTGAAGALLVFQRPFLFLSSLKLWDYSGGSLSPGRTAAGLPDKLLHQIPQQGVPFNMIDIPDRVPVGIKAVVEIILRDRRGNQHILHHTAA